MGTAPSPPAPVRKRKFVLRLADLGSQQWKALPDEGMGGWTTHGENPNAEDTGFAPGLLDEAFGNRCDYGPLFAYLFRRFGLPNLPSDGYKQICEYALTTPLSDMVLLVSPSVNEWPRLSFRFFVTKETWRRLEVEPRDRWLANLVAWREAEGPLPAWMDEWLAFWRAKPNIGSIATGDPSDWGRSLQEIWFVPAFLKHAKKSGEVDPNLHSLLEQVAAFGEGLSASYEAIEPFPGRRQRPACWQDWPDVDPLKLYYMAAAEALRDLSRPVRVRDAAINAYGNVPDEDARRVLEEPEVAGYGFGFYLNQHPAAAAKILALAWKEGKGSMQRGAKKILQLAG